VILTVPRPLSLGGFPRFVPGKGTDGAQAMTRREGPPGARR
jgi:hypothetical protein